MSVDKSPVYNVKAIPVEKIQANDYNPNVVAPPEMKCWNCPSGKTDLQALRVLLRPGERQLYIGGRLPPLSGIENFQADLSARKRFVAGCCN